MEAILKTPILKALKCKSTGCCGRAHFGKVHTKQPLSRESSDSRFNSSFITSIRISSIFSFQNFFTNPELQSFRNWPIKLSWKMGRYTSCKNQEKNMYLRIAQCGNSTVFLSLRFYVKSILGIVEVQNQTFLNTFRGSEV